jgi:hypothetical protein
MSIKFTKKELQEDLDYLKYYLENVINDVANIYNYYLENLKYNDFEYESKLKESNISISKHINKKEFELYLSIIKKYKHQAFVFYTSYWYEDDLETADVEYTTNVLQRYFIDSYIRYLNFEIKN